MITVFETFEVMCRINLQKDIVEYEILYIHNKLTIQSF